MSLFECVTNCFLCLPLWLQGARTLIIIRPNCSHNTTDKFITRNPFEVTVTLLRSFRLRQSLSLLTELSVSSHLQNLCPTNVHVCICCRYSILVMQHALIALHPRRTQNLQHLHKSVDLLGNHASGGIGKDSNLPC